MGFLNLLSKVSRFSAYRPSSLRAPKALYLGGLLLATVGCTYVPFDKQRVPTTAISPENNSIVARSAYDLMVQNGGKSSFVPLFSGTDALGARLRLIEEAEYTIDVQYFLLKPDLAGGLFAHALLNAADRGVKIRFVLDDIFTTTKDEQIAFLNAHENIKIRMYNPLSRNSITAVNYLLDFGRINRRMHNKSLTVDGAMSIVGGRNIADEYFQINKDAEFADFDLFTSGPVAKEIAETFDLFWNDSRAVPMENFLPDDYDLDHAGVRIEILERSSQASNDIYEAATNSKFLRDVRQGRIEPSHAFAEVVTDIPEKLKVKVNKGPQDVADALKKEISSVSTEVLLITPYFVPRASDIEMFKAVSRSGRRVRILTNSLASNNHAPVHGGYAPSRKELLEAGVELYEIRADALQAIGLLPTESEITLTLHTKAAVFDQKRLFVGSMNYDPRSIEINTELGVFVDAPDLSDDFHDRIVEYIERLAYKLSLDENGNIIWTIDSLKGSEIEKSDPGAGFMKRLISGLVEFLPVKGQL